jgi:hypothetical protein
MKLSIKAETFSEGFSIIITAVVTVVAYKAAYWHVERAEGAMIGIAVMFILLTCLGLYSLRMPAIQRLLLKQHPSAPLITAALNSLTANILFQGGYTALASIWCAFVANDIVTSVVIHRVHAGLLGDLTCDPDEDEV